MGNALHFIQMTAFLLPNEGDCREINQHLLNGCGNEAIHQKIREVIRRVIPLTGIEADGVHGREGILHGFALCHKAFDGDLRGNRPQNLRALEVDGTAIAHIDGTGAEQHLCLLSQLHFSCEIRREDETADDFAITHRLGNFILIVIIADHIKIRGLAEGFDHLSGLLGIAVIHHAHFQIGEIALSIAAAADTGDENRHKHHQHERTGAFQEIFPFPKK